jgi:hypothetical protein
VSDTTIPTTSVARWLWRYDAQARLRGAPSNNDGALLFGVRGTF